LGLLALHMFQRHEVSVYFEDLDVHIKEQFSLREARDVENISHDIRTCSFLARDEKDSYSFIHRSFMEYFVAREFERTVESPFRGRMEMQLSDRIVEFMRLERLPLAARLILFAARAVDR
jgi:hypothetical protein